MSAWPPSSSRHPASGWFRPENAVACRGREVDLHAADRVHDVLEAFDVDLEVVRDRHVEVRRDRLDEQRRAAELQRRVEAVLAVTRDRDPGVARERDDETGLRRGLDVDDHHRVGPLALDVLGGSERLRLLLVLDERAAVGADDQEVRGRALVLGLLQHVGLDVRRRDVVERLLEEPIAGVDRDRGRADDDRRARSRSATRNV